jgi:eukaryotic-like serine/threonine-protein kinase
MAITDPLVLPPDVLLVPVTDLPEEVRRQLTWDEGDYAVTRPRSRTPSRIVDAGAAELLGQFRSPVTIVDAVIRFSRGRSLNPETTLEEAYPLLERLLASGFLVAEGTDGAQAIEQSLKPGDRIAGFEVLECVQGLDDTELYQVRFGSETAALKIERPAAAGRSAADFAREAAVLGHLEGSGIAPRLLAQGESGGRHFLAVKWCSGVDGYTAAAELRRKDDRAGLLALARAIVDAYVRLHDRGVIHGDVHPRNVLVSASGEARLIDFGIARWAGSPEAPPGRAGVAFYFEPEYAAPVRAGNAPPDASAAGEQYGLGALLYLLVTGAHYRDFPLEKDRMLRQIEEEPPLPFAEREISPWPELESILARALAKPPQERFPSLAAMAEALAAVTVPAAATRKPGAAAGESLLASVLERLRPEGKLFREGFPEPPRLSINYGAAGAACALYRIALAREDAELLTLADLWAVKAVAGGVAEEGFYNPGKQLDRETLGAVTPYHTPSGPFAMQALVAHALGDPGVQRSAVSGFLEAVKKPCPNPDLTLGRSGVLLAASMLLATLRDKDDLVPPLRELGEGLLRELWQEIGEQPPVPRAVGDWANQGMAHGWAGYLYATLRWCSTAGSPRPEGLEGRLAELAGCARSWGRGLRWPWRDGGGPDASMPGWCNGSAGFVPLWTLAHRELGGSDWLALAEGAAWNAWEAPDRNASLCCGLAGRAYALLDLWQNGGGDAWLDRARDLADTATQEIVRFSEAADSLYKGEVGVAVLLADLANPEAAAQPFFGDEGW